MYVIKTLTYQNFSRILQFLDLDPMTETIRGEIGLTASLEIVVLYIVQDNNKNKSFFSALCTE